MQTVTTDEAQAQLSHLLEAVQRGEEIVIEREGQPIARLTPYGPSRRRILPPGSMSNQGWWMSDDFNESVDGF